MCNKSNADLDQAAAQLDFAEAAVAQARSKLNEVLPPKELKSARVALREALVAIEKAALEYGRALVRAEYQSSLEDRA